MAQSLGTCRERWCGKWESWASLFVIIRWALSLGASSAQYLGQAGRMSEGGMTSLSFSLSLYAFSNLSHEIPPKYMITQELSSLLFLIRPIFLSAFLIYFFMYCFSLNLFFSVCLLKYLSPTIELRCPETLRTSYIMCETDFFWRRRKTHKPYSDWLTDLSRVGKNSSRLFHLLQRANMMVTMINIQIWLLF